MLLGSGMTIAGYSEGDASGQVGKQAMTSSRGGQGLIHGPLSVGGKVGVQGDCSLHWPALRQSVSCCVLWLRIGRHSQ